MKMSELLPTDGTEQPPDLKFGCSVFDIAFHPHQNVLAVGLINGKLDLWVYSYLADIVLHAIRTFAVLQIHVRTWSM